MWEGSCFSLRYGNPSFGTVGVLCVLLESSNVSHPPPDFKQCAVSATSTSRRGVSGVLPSVLLRGDGYRLRSSSPVETDVTVVQAWC